MIDDFFSFFRQILRQDYLTVFIAQSFSRSFSRICKPTNFIVEQTTRYLTGTSSAIRELHLNNAFNYHDYYRKFDIIRVFFIYAINDLCASKTISMQETVHTHHWNRLMTVNLPEKYAYQWIQCTSNKEHIAFCGYLNTP